MRKFSISNPIKITHKLRSKIRKARPSEPATEDVPNDKKEFDEMMERAFPKHLRGSVSGCCDSMESGHGIAGE